MSNLNPGGQRTAPFSRIFGFENIRAAIKRRSPDHYHKARNSIATGNRRGGPHLHQREIARRLRKLEGRAP